MPKKKDGDYGIEIESVKTRKFKLTKNERKLIVNTIKGWLIANPLSAGTLLNKIMDEFNIKEYAAKTLLNEAIAKKVDLSEMSLKLDIAQQKEILWKQVLLTHNAVLQSFQGIPMTEEEKNKAGLDPEKPAYKTTSTEEKRKLLEMQTLASKAFSLVAGTEWTAQNKAPVQDLNISMKEVKSDVDDIKHLVSKRIRKAYGLEGNTGEEEHEKEDGEPYKFKN